MRAAQSMSAEARIRMLLVVFAAILLWCTLAWWGGMPQRDAAEHERLPLPDPGIVQGTRSSAGDASSALGAMDQLVELVACNQAEGRVVDTTGWPIQGARLEALRESGELLSVLSNEEGCYSFGRFLNGERVTVAVTCEGFLERKLECCITEPPTEVVLRRSSAIVVEVSDLSEALDTDWGLHATLFDSKKHYVRQQTVPQRSGELSFESLKSGSYYLLVDGGPCEPFKKDIVLSEGEVGRVLYPEYPVEILEIEVLSQQGQPIPQAWVEAKHGGRGKTNEHGETALGFQSLKRWELKVHARGYKTAVVSRDTALLVGGVVSIRLKELQNTLIVRVIGKNGALVTEEVTVSATGEGNGERYTIEGKDGVFSTRLPEGFYGVEVWVGSTWFQRFLRLENGEVETVDAFVPHMEKITGVIECGGARVGEGVLRVIGEGFTSFLSVEEDGCFEGSVPVEIKRLPCRLIYASAENPYWTVNFGRRKANESGWLLLEYVGRDVLLKVDEATKGSLQVELLGSNGHRFAVSFEGPESEAWLVGVPDDSYQVIVSSGTRCRVLAHPEYLVVSSRGFEHRVRVRPSVVLELNTALSQEARVFFVGDNGRYFDLLVGAERQKVYWPANTEGRGVVEEPRRGPRFFDVENNALVFEEWNGEDGATIRVRVHFGEVIGPLRYQLSSLGGKELGGGIRDRSVWQDAYVAPGRYRVTLLDGGQEVLEATVEVAAGQIEIVRFTR